MGSSKTKPLQSTDPWWVRWMLIGISVAFLTFLLLLPLIIIFQEALSKGIAFYIQSISDRNAWNAVKMTLITAGIAVPLNLIFGIAAAWATTKYRFRGKSILISMIDLPFAISPIVAGLMLVLVFGSQGWWGEWLSDRGIQVIFAVPGVVLATVFVTFPFVARELIPLMQEQGSDEEWAAISLGANGWQTFWKVTLPNIKWALLYGVLLCNARAMGEFGAVSIVSSNIRGRTNTMPLQIDALYSEYQSAAAFALASLLAGLGVFTLIGKTILESRIKALKSDR
ncbi:Sulfate transport system permease protein CysW [Pirellula sp. SH-Sr6A]|uniref:sulfate ABC transporter permease subunit CysW n=1 Tax=Pirellula sp. SH-Sr6A TaxID=1632865 RepID=UPI00078DDD12|nr:sulfate ABC transporter permease subunit CysW [Pirellula sp. SH-Sr6A]AMV33221.1 Sulfate transport system permease protein CysW [Pirellula sp. SH-Sr6A]